MSTISRLLIFFLIGSLTFILIFGMVTQKSQGPEPIDPDTISGEYDPIHTAGEFHGTPVTSIAEAPEAASTRVLGATTEPKRIEVDLTTQTLSAYEGDHLVYHFLISSGKWYPTPTGTFTIWGKFEHTRMKGGSKELHTYYNLPNVPYVMFFSNSEVAASRGFSIHGAYWHDNFGHPMSHGCVNMRPDDARVLYYWADPDIGNKKSGRATSDNPGTTVIIYGKAPKK